jgi:hypothetical protein
MNSDIEDAARRFSAVPISQVLNNDKPLAKPLRELEHNNAHVQLLQHKFDELLRRDAYVRAIVGRLRAASVRAAIFGGWVRDHLTRELGNAQASEPRDIDLVICDLTSSALRPILGAGIKETIFGGFTTKADTTIVDVWPVAETFFIVKHQLAARPELLPQIADFNINAAIFFPRQLSERSIILDGGCIDALNNKSIQFQYPWLAFPEMQAARAVIYSAKLGFYLSSEVQTFIRSVCAEKNRADVVLDGIKKFCPPQLTTDAIRRIQFLLDHRAGP